MKGTVLLHPTCHPKHVSRNRLQMTLNETCQEKFKDVLNADKCMIANHNPDNARRLIITSSLKECEGVENSANHHADEAGNRTMDKGINITRRTREILGKEKIKSRSIEITNSQLKSSGAITSKSHNRKIIVRQER